jgi:hypothetical protein
MKRTSVAVAVAFVQAAACTPTLDDATTRVDAPRIVAIQAEPAEVAPGGTVVLTALIVAPPGVDIVAPPTWRFCTDRRPPTTSGPIAETCLDGETGGEDAPAASGERVTLEVPPTACRLFGPDPPPVEESDPAAAPDGGVRDATEVVAPGTAGRPTDPDFTGGYHQPVVVRLGEDGPPVVFGLRLTCNPAGARRQDAAELRRFGHPNGAPRLSALDRLTDTAASVSLPGLEAQAEPPRFQRGTRLDLRARWPACPAEGRDACGDEVCGPREDATGCPADCATPHPCAGGERYLTLDPAAGLTVRREGLQLTWFVTGGSLARPRTGLAGVREVSSGASAEVQTTESANTWTLSEPGEHTLWVVIRDERGGTSWQGTRVEVGP